MRKREIERKTKIGRSRENILTDKARDRRSEPDGRGAALPSAPLHSRACSSGS